MKIEKINLEGKKSSVEVKDSIFSSKINEKLISSVIYKTNANYKGRSSKTKQKNEIIGSTSKIYAQKGTGNARHASRKAPIFVGGGIAHGPKGRNSYKTRKLNKNEKRQSISSILSKKLKLKEVIVFDDFSKEIKKTKEMDKILKKFDAKNSILILDKNSKDKIFRATKNIPNVKCTDIGHFSAYDILKFKKICSLIFFSKISVTKSLHTLQNSSGISVFDSDIIYLNQINYLSETKL